MRCLFDRYHACLQVLGERGPWGLGGGRVSFPIPATAWWTDRKRSAGTQETKLTDTNWNLASGVFTFFFFFFFYVRSTYARLRGFSIFPVTAISALAKYTLLISTTGYRLLTTLFFSKAKAEKWLQIDTNRRCIVSSEHCLMMSKGDSNDLEKSLESICELWVFFLPPNNKNSKYKYISNVQKHPFH